MSDVSLNTIISDPIVFLNKLFSLIEDSGMNVDEFYLDHICYRVGSESEYQEKKIQLLNHGKMLIESMVNGRLIATYKLHSPISYKGRLIDVVELPAPKPGHSYASGLEHVEFVSKKPLQSIVDQYPKLSFETQGINKEINADITLRLGEYCIRFHNQTLEEVIEEEKKLMGKN